jgi:hypothetical protein
VPSRPARLNLRADSKEMRTATQSLTATSHLPTIRHQIRLLQLMISDNYRIK